MRKLYYENQYIKEFITDIKHIEKFNEKYHIVLEKTAFFPGGGGQFCDLGFIENERVVDVFEENRVVYHVLENEPRNKNNVKCYIDWDRRSDGMHQHLGQHIISGCFFKLFNANTVSFHLGKEFSTVDIVGNLEEYKIKKVEEFANEVIGKGLEVESIVPSKESLEMLELRRALPKTDEEIRVLKVGDLDINACCGVHPSSTKDVRLIKIIKWEKNKENTRIQFLAGKRAVEDSLNKEKYLSDMCRYLNTNPIEILNRVRNLENKIKEISDINRKLNDEMVDYEVDNLKNEQIKIEGITIIKKIYENKDLKYIGKVAEKLVENESVVVLFANKNEDKSNIIFSSAKNVDFIKMNEILKETINLINGKGGGSKFLAQGSGENENLEEFLELAFRKVNDSIILSKENIFK